MTRYIEINKKQYPFRNSYSAKAKFQRIQQKDPHVISDYTLDDYVHAILYGIESGCKYEKKPFDLDFESLMDAVDAAEYDWMDLFCILTDQDKEVLKKAIEETNLKLAVDGSGGNG